MVKPRPPWLVLVFLAPGDDTANAAVGPTGHPTPVSPAAGSLCKCGTPGCD